MYVDVVVCARALPWWRIKHDRLLKMTPRMTLAQAAGYRPTNLLTFVRVPPRVKCMIYIAMLHGIDRWVW